MGYCSNVMIAVTKKDFKIKGSVAKKILTLGTNLFSIIFMPFYYK